MDVPAADSDRDVLLVTIDCWRLDALERMGRLRSRFSDEECTRAISHGMATYWAFPPLLASGYYPRVYGESGIDSDVRTLPDVLGEAGYATGAVIGSNPNLLNWTSPFEYYDNAGLTDAGDGFLSRLRERIRQASELITLDNSVSVTDVAARSQRWYERTEGPRFLWTHLMDLHAPYFPGLRHGIDAGLFRTYEAVLRYYWRHESASPRVRKRVRNLYWRCVDRLDERIGQLLDIVDDDTIVIITGDHGEALHREVPGHRRPYEEVLQVPLITRNLPTVSSAEPPVRLIDIPPTILSASGHTAPEEWEGTAVDGSARTALVLSRSPRAKEVYAGIRSSTHRLVYTIDQDSGELLDKEFVQTESGEPATDSNVEADLEAKLTEFLNRESIRDNLGKRIRPTSDVVQQRLENLGYT